MPKDQTDGAAAADHGSGGKGGRWSHLWAGLRHGAADEYVAARFYKVTRWLLFGVVIGLLPFVFPFVNVFVSDAKPDVVDWRHVRDTLFGRGDLLLIAATLVAASSGDLIGSGREREGGKILAGFSCFVIFSICVVWYGIVADKIEAHVVYNVSRTARASLWLFGFSVLCSAGCLLLGEEAKRVARKKGSKMNEPWATISLCVAGLGAVSTLAVALFGRPPKPRDTPPAQGRLDFGEDAPTPARPEEKVFAEHR